ncbi:MAG: S-methyl-5'-thioinosine phosphorylase [Gammaproteobacteria bacterium]|nr:S-methyl-5'-thioinosine phosphorylase [Gammaproteobacteria bacterium]
MARYAIIGGSGITRMDGLEIIRREVLHTPFGEPSAPLTHGTFHGLELLFLPRHGAAHTLPPHRVNYRANLWALRQAGVEKIVAIAAVGSLNPRISPGSISIPDQIIDYTYSRAQTFFEENLQHVTHIDFTYPYCETLRQALLRAAAESGIEATSTATYGATQGPRLETKAEIDRMGRDGCDLVGMTGMPEAALARELDLCYACCAVVANWAAGRGDGLISMEEIEGHLKDGMHKVYKILSKLFISV